MAVKFSPVGNDAPFVDSNGNPLSGGLLYTYTAGSSTPENTYTTNLGNVANANPIVLNANGYPSSAGNVVSIWLTAGTSYLFTLKTSGGTTVWSRDNITGINDTSVSVDQWVSGATPTYVSATSFTLAGDQTTTYHVGRRLKTTNSGGTIYSTITASAYGALTTITVANDSGTLDAGLSAVSYGLISAANTSVDAEMIYRKGTAVASAATCNIWGIVGEYIHITGSTGPITSFGTAPYAGDERTLIFDSTPTITANATTLQTPGGGSLTMAAGDRMVVRADTTANMIITQVTRAAANPFNGMPRSYLAGFGIANNGSDATNDIDFSAGAARDSTNTVDILGAAMTKRLDAGWVAGTNQGMRNSAAAITDTTYHLYAVSTATGTQDYYAHTSTTVATVITALQAEAGGSAYLYARRIASIVRAGATIVAFSQSGDEFLRSASIASFTAVVDPGTTAVTQAMAGIPTGLVLWVIANWSTQNAAAGVAPSTYISALVQSDEAPVGNAIPFSNAASQAQSAAGGSGTWNLQLTTRTNTSAQVRYRLSASDGNVTFEAATLGWIDRRGRED